MGFRRIAILFFSTMTVSLVILLVLFNLVFKNIDLSFDTKMPESAPILEDEEPAPSFKAGAISGASVKTPDSAPAVPPSPAVQTAQEAVDSSSDALPGTPAPPSLVTVTEPPPPAPKKPLVGPHPLPSHLPGNSPEPGFEPRLRPRVATPAPAPTPPLSPPPPKALYQVYVDGYGSDIEARAAAEALKNKGVEAFAGLSGGRPVVKLGTFSSRDSAEAVAGQNGAKIRPVAP